MTTEPKRRSNPPSVHIEDTQLFREINGLKAEYGLIRDRKFISIVVEGLPGLGKTFLAKQILNTGSDNRLIPVAAHAANLADVLHRYRHPRFILLWDDVNFVFDSQPVLNILNHAVDAHQAVRVIVDNRKGGHGNFPHHARHVFLTNKHLITDPDLMEFDKSLRSQIAPLKSRFALRRALTKDMTEAFHYSCWLATDGAHLLRKMTFEGRSLSVDASNEVLDWFAQHFPFLDEVSPRRLVMLAQFRLKAPEVWESLAQPFVMTKPRTETVLQGKQVVEQPVATPPAWCIRTVPVHEKAVKSATLAPEMDEPIKLPPAKTPAKPAPRKAPAKKATKKTTAKTGTKKTTAKTGTKKSTKKAA